MEALIVAIATLALLVLIDAGHWIAISLVRWSPIIAIGVLAGWLAHHHGAECLEALGVGFLASVVARHFTRPRFIHCGRARQLNQFKPKPESGSGAASDE